MSEAGSCVEYATGIGARTPSYRSEWVARNGTTVRFRLIGPGDFGLESDFVSGLSRSTSYMRLMSGRTPSAEDIRRWTAIDRQREGAIVAIVLIDGLERLIGVARYAALPREHEAEIAIVISDAWQGKGLGVPLLGGLIELARQSGMTRLFGTTLSENAAMIGLGRRYGFSVTRTPGAAYVTELALDLHPEAVDLLE